MAATSKAVAVCVVLASLVLGNSVASAQSVEHAKRAYLEADFHVAMREFESLLKSPRLTRNRALEAHRYMATLRGILGDSQAARDHIRAALALDPRAEPVPGTPDDLARTFSRLRKNYKVASRLSLVENLGANTRTVTAKLSPAPDWLKGTVTLECVGGGAERNSVIEGTETTVELDPRSGELNCSAQAMTAYGAVLFRERARFVGAPGGNPYAAASRGERADDGKKSKRWIWYVVAGVVAAGGATAGAVLATRSDKQRIEISGVTVSGWE